MDYKDLIPDSLLSENRDIKIQLFTEDFILNPETEFIVINLDVDLSWCNICYNFLFDLDYKWSCVKFDFNRICEKISPEMKDVFIKIKPREQKLKYNTRDLNRINNRKLTDYPWMPVKWEGNNFITVLPVYFFQPLEVEKRRFILVS